MVTNHHHHILGSSMALWCNGRTTVLLAEETRGCCVAALEAGGWRRMELPIVSTEEELLAAAEMEGDEGVSWSRHVPGPPLAAGLLAHRAHW